MAEAKSRVSSAREVLSFLRRYQWRWLLPAATVTVLTAGYALTRPTTWEASLPLVVRDEASGATRPGKFILSDAMKTTQETILELARSRKVLEAALLETGRPESLSESAAWPSEPAVDSLQDALKITPPKGAEFGKTEVFYLKVQDRSRPRAIALASAVCRQLQRQFELLRGQKANSVTAELEKTVALAEAELNESTHRLRDVEMQAGSDLAELRMLNEVPSGDGGLRKISIEIANELRVQKAAVKSNEELLTLLTQAQDDPGRLLASPGRLLESQPALKRLKEGLVDAQLLTAKLLGNMAPEHPQVKAAKAAEQEISDHLHDELAIAVRGVEADLQLARHRVQMLDEQGANVRERMERLASIRAEYSNLASAVKHRTEILKTAQQELADARASQATSGTVSLINPVNEPDTGSRPLGPGRTMICLAGMFGGLFAGLGILFLTVNPKEIFEQHVEQQGSLTVPVVLAPTPKSAVVAPAPAPAITVSRPVKPAATPTVLSFKQALQKLSGNGLN
jgi:uncharacterized protein involved in exopolysaccharide biosynthesis